MSNISKPALYLNIAIDDIRPELGYGMPSDRQCEWIRALHDITGCKYTFFVPANYYERLPLSHNIHWVNYWLDKGYVELAAHGYSHSHPMGHEMEFFDCDATTSVDKFERTLGEFLKVGVRPEGFRFPGWQHSLPAAEHAAKYFNYVAANQYYNTKFGTFVITHPRGIDEFTEDDIHDGFLKLHSHISLPSNNWWNEENYERTLRIIYNLSEKYELKHIFLRDMEAIVDKRTEGTRNTLWGI